MYSVKYSKTATKALSKLDRITANMIVTWIENNLLNCTNPRISGRALTGNYKGYWRYRVGAYRIIAQITDTTITINIVNIGHRRNIYEQ